MNPHNKKILDLIHSEEIVTTSEIAGNLDISWNTADSYLKDLALDNKLRRIKKEGVTLWLKK
ncbi:hypothetical protein EXS73_00725 [Candidatus Pacearchaeota archaeon]|nr:hypothetical protein [Candidatus Pacearchaeota archaeon]